MRAFVFRASDRTSAKPHRLGDVEGGLDSLGGDVHFPGEVLEATDLGRQRGEVGVGLIGGEDAVGLVHAGEGVAQPSVVPHAFRVPRRNPGGRMARTSGP